MNISLDGKIAYVGSIGSCQYRYLRSYAAHVDPPSCLLLRSKKKRYLTTAKALSWKKILIWLSCFTIL